MYINNNFNQTNIYMGGGYGAPSMGGMDGLSPYGDAGGCGVSMGADSVFPMLQSMAGAVAGMSFLGGSPMMQGGFSPSMSPNFGGMGGIGGSENATKGLTKAIRQLTKFLGRSAKAGKGKHKKSKGHHGKGHGKGHGKSHDAKDKK